MKLKHSVNFCLYDLYQLIYVKFRSQTKHILPIIIFFLTFSFFLPLKIQISHSSRSTAAATHTGKLNSLNTFSTFQSVVFITARIVFEFSSQIFSDLFPLSNMLATAITSEPSRQARAYYETNKNALKNKKVRFHFKIEVKK